MNHRGDYFHGVVAEIRELLPVLFGAKGHQVILSGSGSAGLEAMYSGLIRKGERTLVLTNGNFGERTDQIVRRYCDSVTTLSAPWGQHMPIEAAVAELEKGDVRAVCVVHNETSVGLSTTSRGSRPTSARSGALFLVDGISAVAGIPCPIEAWGDRRRSSRGARRGSARPGRPRPGPPLRPGRRGAEPGSFYLDLPEHLKNLEKNDTPWTPAVPLFLALREALLLLKEEALEGPPRADPPSSPRRRGPRAPRSSSSCSRTGRTSPTP